MARTKFRFQSWLGGRPRPQVDTRRFCIADHPHLTHLSRDIGVPVDQICPDVRPRTRKMMPPLL